MLCAEIVFKTRVPCRHPAKYMVIAAAAPRVVCGVHARQFLKKALIPLNLFGPNFDTRQLPDINGFLRSMSELGVKVSVTGTEIVINVSNKERSLPRTI